MCKAAEHFIYCNCRVNLINTFGTTPFPFSTPFNQDLICICSTMLFTIHMQWDILSAFARRSQSVRVVITAERRPALFLILALLLRARERVKVSKCVRRKIFSHAQKHFSTASYCAAEGKMGKYTTFFITHAPLDGALTLCINPRNIWEIDSSSVYHIDVIML